MGTKTKTIFSLLLLIFAFSACNMEKRLYRPGFYLDIPSHNISASIHGPVGKTIPVENDFEAESPSKIKITKAVVISKTDRSTDSIPQKVDSSKIVSISPLVGKVIDKDEKIKYHLFPFFKTEDFVSAYFIQEADGSLFLIGNFKNDTQRRIPYTMQQFQDTQMNNFNDEVVAKANGKTVFDEYGECKRASGSVVAAFPLTIISALAFLANPIVASVLFLIGLFLAISGSNKANRILRKHKMNNDTPNDFKGRAEAVFASRAAEIYFLLLILWALFIVWIFLKWDGII